MHTTAHKNASESGTKVGKSHSIWQIFTKKKYSVIILIEIDFGNENVNRKIYWHFQKHA